ncbi:hypothetical protein Gotur_030343 [Gossypium turneri]
MSHAWNQTRRMKILAVDLTMTPEYSQWCDQRINDNISALNPKTTRSLEEHLQVLTSKIEIIKQEFEKKSQQIEKRKEQGRRRFRQPEDGLQEVAQVNKNCWLG